MALNHNKSYVITLLVSQRGGSRGDPIRDIEVWSVSTERNFNLLSSSLFFRPLLKNDIPKMKRVERVRVLRG